MKQGDFVTRISYGHDVVFKIEKLQGDVAILRGVEYRLLADAPLDDLRAVQNPFSSDNQEAMRSDYEQNLAQLRAYRQQMLKRNLPVDDSGTWSDSSAEEGGSVTPVYFEVPGKVLHLDGDPGYLRKSMTFYRALRVPAEGHYVQESQMANVLHRLLPSVRPNIVVITGHDGMYKNRQTDGQYDMGNYKNSANFAEAVKIARQYERDMDALVIVAGACQSYFEALLHAGANFASSPGRILIHALDPVHIASKMAFASVKETVRMTEVIEHTMSGLKGIGGIETRGCHRLGVPYTEGLTP